MAEFSAIDKHLKQFSKDSSVFIGIGDDAAVIEVPENHFQVQTLDVMVQGVHFDESYSASELAHKLLHVNLSDIAAMGAKPKWATIGMVVPSLDSEWLSEFSQTLKQQADLYGVNLIGGDTSQGAFTLSLNLCGIALKTDGVLTRSGAQAGDDIYVSGTLGDAALALEQEHSNNTALQQRLRLPQARVELGPKLLAYATACLDVSDGLMQDLTHICQQSKVNAELNVEQLPLSEAYTKATSNVDFALNGGDDYELCFTAPVDHRSKLDELSSELSLPLTRIGKIKPLDAEQQTIKCLLHQEAYQCKRKGWQHFD